MSCYPPDCQCASLYKHRVHFLWCASRVYLYDVHPFCITRRLQCEPLCSVHPTVFISLAACTFLSFTTCICLVVCTSGKQGHLVHQCSLIIPLTEHITEHTLLTDGIAFYSVIRSFDHLGCCSRFHNFFCELGFTCSSL